MKVLLIVSEDWLDFDLAFETVHEVIHRNCGEDAPVIEYFYGVTRARFWASIIADTEGVDHRELSGFDQDICLAFISQGDDSVDDTVAIVQSNDVPTVKFLLP